MSHRAPTIGAVALASTVAAFYFTTQAQIAYPHAGGSGWLDALWLNLVFYWMWGAAVPMVVHLARRLPLDQASWRRSVPLHLFAGAVITVGQIAAAQVVLSASLGGSALTLPGETIVSIRKSFHSSYPTYWVILLAATVWRAASLQSRLAEARLAALDAQLQPHFLFNTLNSVSALMYRDVEAADAMIARLSDLLRLTLRGEKRREIPLRDEMDLLRRYLDIERVRFEERLLVTIDVAPDAEGALVPPFLLQPVVENGIRHAVAPRASGGRLSIAAHVHRGRLVIRVADDGPGLPPGGGKLGIGLSNTRARLAELHGAGASLDLDQGQAGGLVVTLVLPCRA